MDAAIPAGRVLLGGREWYLRNQRARHTNAQSHSRLSASVPSGHQPITRSAAPLEFCALSLDLRGLGTLCALPRCSSSSAVLLPHRLFARTVTLPLLFATFASAPNHPTSTSDSSLSLSPPRQLTLRFSCLFFSFFCSLYIRFSSGCIASRLL